MCFMLRFSRERFELCVCVFALRHHFVPCVCPNVHSFFFHSPSLISAAFSKASLPSVATSDSSSSWLLRQPTLPLLPIIHTDHTGPCQNTGVVFATHPPWGTTADHCGQCGGDQPTTTAGSTGTCLSVWSNQTCRDTSPALPCPLGCCPGHY